MAGTSKPIVHGHVWCLNCHTFLPVNGVLLPNREISIGQWNAYIVRVWKSHHRGPIAMQYTVLVL